MLQAPIPKNEPNQLLEASHEGVLDSPEEEALAEIAALVRLVAGTPISTISLLDENRQCFRSCTGLGAEDKPQHLSFCSQTTLQSTPLIIEDALDDERFRDTAHVRERPNIRFYAGFPLISATGLALGSLCAVDSKPHQLSGEQLDALERLARLVVQLLEIKGQSRLQKRSQQDLELESELRHGLSLGQLEPHFQPLFDLRTRAVMGFEVLARWRSQSGELLLPSAFLPAVERAELMADLDLQMIAQAIACSHELAQLQGEQPQLLSLNLSSPLLENSQQLQRLHTVIDHNPLPQHWRLQLEVLEGHLQQNETVLQQHLQSLHRRGVALAIDDFGTGYSSLGRLNSFPFSSLKVDMSFVKLLNAKENASNRILEVIAAMAQALDLHTTAEGIETEEQLQWLMEHGLDWGQGYLIAKPMPLLATLDFLRCRQGSVAKKR